MRWTSIITAISAHWSRRDRSGHKRSGRRGDVPRGQPVFGEQVFVGRRFAEGVADAHSLHWRGMLFAEYFGDGATSAADDGVVLGGDDLARLFCGGDDGVFVKGFEGRQV